MKYILSILFSATLFFSQGEAQFSMEDVISSLCPNNTVEAFAECLNYICEEGEAAALKDLPPGLVDNFCSTELDSDRATSSINSQIWRMINTISLLAGAVAILMITLSGFKMITSLGGDDLEKAKQGLLWSIVALLVILFSYVIVATVVNSIYEIGDDSIPEEEEVESEPIL